VIHVENGNGCAEFVQRRQQENGVRSAGNGDADSSAASNCCGYLIDHTSILREAPIASRNYDETVKLLIFSDIHSDGAALQRLMAIEADYYFCAGDLVNWARGLDAMGEIMKPRAERLYVIPGNHESAEQIEAFCAKFGFHNFHGSRMQIGGFEVAGLGYSNPTPFDTPGEYSEEELEKRLHAFDNLKPLIAICHAPPFGTPLDRITNLKHAGSRSMREFIQREQPRYFFCGHIHEAAGAQDKLGETSAMNVGKQGYLLDLEQQKEWGQI
jgi:Icc-related predicted phosphoesterase